MPLIDSLSPATEAAPVPAVDQPRPRSNRRSNLWWWVLAVAGVVLLALTFRPVIEGDGVGYYSYLHAVFVSHNLSFESEYAAARASGVDAYRPWITNRENGHLTDLFPVGSALLSAPAYLIALALAPAGAPQYGTTPSSAFVLSSLLFGLLGLAMSYAIAAQVVGDRRAALVGVIAGVFGTPLAFYPRGGATWKTESGAS
jgi:hypothetical protein